MGAGASAGLEAALLSTNATDIKDAFGAVSQEDKDKVLAALGSEVTLGRTNSSPARALKPTFLVEADNLARTKTDTECGIPIVKASDIKRGEVSRKFQLKNGFDNPWFGPMQFTIQGEAWVLDAFLGGGAFGQAYMATHVASGQRYLLKFLESRRDGKCAEIDFLKQVPRALIKHPNIVTYAALALDLDKTEWAPAQHIVFMEVVPNGELFDFLIEGGGAPVQEGTMRRFVRDVINGLAECVRHGITHRDLKPENMLIDDNGSIVIIDLGAAKKTTDGPEDASPVASTSAESAELEETTPVSAFMRVQTKGVGTPFYHAPEIDAATRMRGLSAYDSERADVFAVGTVTFMLYRPTFPFNHPRGVGVFADLGEHSNPKFWAKADKQNSGRAPPFPQELKDFLNMLWRQDPAERPTFDELKKVIDNDAEVLKKFPGLSWLAGKISDPLEFVRELRKRRPNMMLKSSGVVESLALFGRKHANAAAAFAAANSSNDGNLKLSELKSALCTISDNCTDDSTADLMRRYMKDTESTMNAEQFERMSKEWEFGGRPIVWGVGEFMVRRFAFSGKALPIQQAEIDEFVRVTSEGLEKEGHAVKSEESEMAASRTVTMLTGTPKKEVCVLRLDFSELEGKIVIEAHRTWGSAIDELLIERQMNDHLVESWGPRADCPTRQA